MKITATKVRRRGGRVPPAAARHRPGKVKLSLLERVLLYELENRPRRLQGKDPAPLGEDGDA
jgi:hypothetical protein